MEVKTIPGNRRGSVYYTCAADSGFFYRINRSKNQKKFLKCVENNCPARACCDDAVFFLIGEGHNHIRDVEKERTLHLKASMLNEACSTSESVKAIFVRNSASAPVDVASKLAFPAIAKSMRRYRRKAQPEMPTSLEELGEICQESVRFGQIDGDHFCRGNVGNGNSLSVLFLPEGLKNLLKECKEVHLDGTFKTHPQHPRSNQLLTIMVVHYGFAFPCGFALMSSRKKDSYNAVFEKIQEIIPEFNPKLIITDFETALVQSLATNFPEAQKTGCWFHYCQAILRKVGDLGMKPLLRENPQARKAVKMLMCVPLLPAANIEEGVTHISNFLRSNNLAGIFETLLSYHSRQWLQKVGADSISVYNRTRRTNNDSESLHAAMRRILGVRNPNVWEFIDGLRNISAATVREIKAFVDEGLQIRAIGKRKYKFNSQRIKNAATVFEEDGNIGAYLEVVAYSVQGLIRQTIAEDQQVGEENEDYPLTSLPGDLPPEFNTNGNVELEADEDEADQDEGDGMALNDANRREENHTSMCMICLTSPPTTVLLPCKHFGLCDACTAMRQRLNDIPPTPEDLAYDTVIDHSICPADRIPIEQYVRVVHM